MLQTWLEENWMFWCFSPAVKLVTIGSWCNYNESKLDTDFKSTGCECFTQRRLWGFDWRITLSVQLWMCITKAISRWNRNQRRIPISKMFSLCFSAVSLWFWGSLGCVTSQHRCSLHFSPVDGGGVDKARALGKEWDGAYITWKPSTGISIKDHSFDFDSAVDRMLGGAGGPASNLSLLWDVPSFKTHQALRQLAQDWQLTSFFPLVAGLYRSGSLVMWLANTGW